MRQSKRHPPLNEHTWAQASDWFLRFSEEEVDATARELFNDWLRMSPENIHAYLHVAAFWQAADQLGQKDDGSRNVDALVARAKIGGNVFPLALGPQSHFEAADPSVSDTGAVLDTPTKTREIPRFAMAASLFVAMVALGAYGYLQRGVYQTDIGEQRVVNLPDGSTMTLNANSRVTVRYTDIGRTIDLDEGQALFKVARNAARPFVVRSGEMSVRAVGTQFDVYRKASGTVVTVVEGKVAISDPPRDRADTLLSAGEQITVVAVTSEVSRSIPTKVPPPPVIQPVRLETATAWTEGLLVFDAAPLDDVVLEFNRQNGKPLVLEGAGLEAVRITGTFPASGSDRITRFLQERHGVVINETDDDIRISIR